ncbi:MAG: hypothetical protein EZS28_045991, partial [Streblomastix strix]
MKTEKHYQSCSTCPNPKLRPFRQIKVLLRQPSIRMTSPFHGESRCAQTVHVEQANDIQGPNLEISGDVQHFFKNRVTTKDYFSSSGQQQSGAAQILYEAQQLRRKRAQKTEQQLASVESRETRQVEPSMTYIVGMRRSIAEWNIELHATEGLRKLLVAQAWRKNPNWAQYCLFDIGSHG